MGVTPGKPLGDIRAFVAKFRSYEGIGELPPIMLAALRKRMVALAAEIADGVIFANASRSHMANRSRRSRRQSAPTRLPHRQHDPDLHLRRYRGREGGQPPHADPLHDAAELPQLLEGGRLRRGDGGDRDGASPRAAETTSRRS